MHFSELLTYVPRHKHDLETANAAVALGWPAVEPITPQLLEWLQDCNWPVANILAPFFAKVGSGLAPYIRSIFQTDDDVWKYWIIQRVVAESPALIQFLAHELKRIALSPTVGERIDEVDLEACEVLKNL